MLFPYISDPDTGSRIPSISTGGAAMKATMNTEVAVNKVGIINTPNHPMYKRFSVEVIQEQKRPHTVAFARRSKVAVIIKKNKNFKELQNLSFFKKRKHIRSVITQYNIRTKPLQNNKKIRLYFVILGK